MNAAAFPLVRDDETSAALDAVLDAVGESFPWLERDAILHPASGAGDGSILARQITFYTLSRRFGLPMKRLAALGYDLGIVRRSVRSIKARHADARFALWVDRVGERAVNIDIDRERRHG